MKRKRIRKKRRKKDKSPASRQIESNVGLNNKL